MTKVRGLNPGLDICCRLGQKTELKTEEESTLLLRHCILGGNTKSVTVILRKDG